MADNSSSARRPNTSRHDGGNDYSKSRESNKIKRYRIQHPSHIQDNINASKWSDEIISPAARQLTKRPYTQRLTNLDTHQTPADTAMSESIIYETAQDLDSSADRFPDTYTKDSLANAVPYLTTPDIANIKIPADSTSSPKCRRWLRRITPYNARARARTLALVIAKRGAVCALFLLVVSLLLIPVHDAESRKLDYTQMAANWTTRPRKLVPFDASFAYNVLLDAHAHTTHSDGRLTPQQLVDYSIAQGYNALIVTDHNTVSGALVAEQYAAERYAGRLVVIPGMEYSTCRIHMNFINVNVTVTDGNSAVPSDSEIRAAIAAVHALGGLVIVNHIPWSNYTLDKPRGPRLPNHPSVRALVEWGVDGFEVVNQATFDFQTMHSIQAINAERIQKAIPPLVVLAGSDTHAPAPAYSWTVLNATRFSKAAIVEEIRRARTSFIFDPTGSPNRPEIPISSWWMALSPLIGVADYFEAFYDRHQGQYSFHGSHCANDVVEVHGPSIALFVVYFVVALLLFELLLFAVTALRDRIMHKSNDFDSL